MSYSNLADIIEDTLAPKLISLDLFHKDLEDNGEILKIDANSWEDFFISFGFKDDISGIEAIEVVWESPSGAHKLEAYSSDNLIEGNILEGKSVSSFGDYINPFPYENGIWNLYEIGLIDKAGNYTFLSKEEVEILGGTTQFLLENSSEDLDPPSIKNVEFNQKTFDFSKENVNDLFIKIQ